MRLSKLIGQRIKDAPKDATSASHIFMMRGGYVRPLSTGIYTLLPLGKRVINKIEKIIRQEMDGVDSQEMLMPVVNPAEIWQESGRLDSVDATLLRFKDRNQKDMVLAMTHEEAVCHMARTEITSYKQLPASVYHLQTKYRDEARPRAGLIRVREFTMKDAYSFHASDECLNAYYERVHGAYERIFARLGMTNTLSIASDTGMIGGTGAHEFMAVSDIGEDTIFFSPCRSYKANREIAKSPFVIKSEAQLELEKVSTPGQKTIDEVSSFLKVSPSDTCKAVFFGSEDKGYANKVILVLIRGDLEVNETKLQNHLKVKSLYPAHDDQILACGAVPGYASPVGIDKSKCRMIVDPTVAKSSNLVAGANAEDLHYINYNHGRDTGWGEVIDIASVREGDPCPVTGAPLMMAKGIEIGNIFKLGTRYSKAMGVNYLDQNGKSQPAIMGCYGIGVGRAMASVVEQCHDQYGPIWPLAIAPFQLHIIGLASGKPEVSAEAEALYKEFTEAGIEVLFDDRDPKAGFAFADADLIGIPYRLIISPKSLEQGGYEFKIRGQKDSIILNKITAVLELTCRIKDELARA